MIFLKRLHIPPVMRLGASVALIAVIALTAAGCKTIHPAGIGGSSAADPRRDSAPSAPIAVDAWGKRYRAAPNDPDTVINYARVLRANGQTPQAAALLEGASSQNPKHTGLLSAYARALADMGNFQQALEALNRAHTLGQPNWRILSMQGAMLDQMGRHDDAQLYYGTALRIVPDEPSVLSNLGLSYALSKDLIRAESTLRRASAQPLVDPEVRRNLAWIVLLQKRLRETDSTAQAAPPLKAADGNITYLRHKLAEQNGFNPGDGPRSGVLAKGG
jgi:Flp pilus assembly protein TadD